MQTVGFALQEQLITIFTSTLCCTYVMNTKIVDVVMLPQTPALYVRHVIGGRDTGLGRTRCN